MTFGELLKEGEEALLLAGVPESRLDAWYLFSYCFSMEKSRYFLYMETELPEGKKREAEAFLRLIGMREKRIPLQQILGSQEFMGLSFFIDGRVLIPRQDTEALVEKALEGEKTKWRRIAGENEKVRASGKAAYRLLDLCTGSGCIGLSLAVYLGDGERAVLKGGGRTGSHASPGPEIILSDISEEALEVAEKNIRRLGLEGVCRTVKSDLFEGLSGERFDCIVSNPPYIPSREIETLSPEVKDYEPRIALDGSADGLSFYRKISKEAAGHLVPGGRLYLEIGWDQGASVPELLRAAGFFRVEVVKDLAGNDRVVKAVRPGGMGFQAAD